MNIELSVKEENGVVKIKITSPDKPVVIETDASANTAGTPVTAAAEQNESVSPATEAATTDDTLKAEATALSAKLAAMNREYERVKKAAYRAGIRLKENLKALGQIATLSATSTNRPSPAPAGLPCAVPRVPEVCSQTVLNVPNGNSAVPDICPQTFLNVPNSVPGGTWGQGQVVTSYNSTTNTLTHNHVFDNDSDNVFDHTMSDPVMTHKEAETINTQSPEPIGNCLPFVSEKTSHQFIPLANLPEVYQNLLQAWNQLPLRSKLKGLYPDMMEKLHHLLQEFGEATLHKAIRMVADSPFLLGKSSNSSGWVINFGWLLKQGNLKKILENKYRDRSREWKQGNECVTYPEYIPWSTVQNTVNHTTVTANAYTENMVNHTTLAANTYTENTVNHTTVTANAYTENMVNHTTLTANGYESPATPAGYGDPLSEEYSADNAAQTCFLNPEYMLKGLDPLTDQARSNLAWAAARLGLTKTPAA